MEIFDQNTTWYVIQTKSRYEKRSFELLSKQGIMAYLPLQKKIKIWSDRKKEVEEPLFTGYLFVQFTENERYIVLNTPGVVRLVSFGGHYAKIDNKQVVAIKRAIESDDLIEIVDISFEPGQEVLITSGPFRDSVARVIRSKNGNKKLLLSLEAIGKGIMLEIGKNRVEMLAQV